MELTLNGVTHRVSSSPLTSLLQTLREELGVTSAKAGCQQGGCGSCTVLVDGEARRSCLTPVAEVEGAEVTTVEGLGTRDALSPLQAAFYAKYGAQCGFCTSGMILAATELVERGDALSREEIVEEMAGHICRCTGYVKIVDAIEAAVRGDTFDVDALRTGLNGEQTPDQTAVPGAPA